MLVSRHLGEVLDDRLVDDRPPLIGLEEDEALAKHVVSPDVAAEFKDTAAVFEGFADECGHLVRLLVFLDEFIFEQHLKGASAMHVRGDLPEIGPDHIQHALKLLLSSLLVELLAEEVRDLVHHQLVERLVLLEEKLVEEVTDELDGLPWLLLLRGLEHLLVDSLLQNLTAVFVLGE